MNEKSDSVKDVAALYANDLDFIEENLSDDPTGFWARSLIKTSVSFFEADLHLIKLDMLKVPTKKNIILPSDVQYMLNGKKFELTSSSLISNGVLQNRLKDEIKFVFRQVEIIMGFSLTFDYCHTGWQNLVDTINVRNRLTHPKKHEEQMASKS